MTKYFILDIFQPRIKRQTDSIQFIVELPWLTQVLQKKKSSHDITYLESSYIFPKYHGMPYQRKFNFSENICAV